MNVVSLHPKRRLEDKRNQRQETVRKPQPGRPSRHQSPERTDGRMLVAEVDEEGVEVAVCHLRLQEERYENGVECFCCVAESDMNAWTLLEQTFFSGSATNQTPNAVQRAAAVKAQQGRKHQVFENLCV